MYAYSSAGEHDHPQIISLASVFSCAYLSFTLSPPPPQSSFSLHGQRPAARCPSVLCPNYPRSLHGNAPCAAPQLPSTSVTHTLATPTAMQLDISADTNPRYTHGHAAGQPRALRGFLHNFNAATQNKSTPMTCEGSAAVCKHHVTLQYYHLRLSWQRAAQQ